MSTAARRRALLSEWIELSRGFLASHPLGTTLESAALAELLERRAGLLGSMAAAVSEDPAAAKLAAQVRELEAVLLERVEMDLERRRREVEELDQTRHALRGYSAEPGTEKDVTARYIDTRS